MLTNCGGEATSNPDLPMEEVYLWVNKACASAYPKTLDFDSGLELSVGQFSK